MKIVINKNNIPELHIPIIDLESIPQIVKNEGLDVAIISHGGCASNMIASYLNSKGIKVYSDIWHKILCHCPKPVKLDIPIIYIYRNLADSLASQKRRGIGIWDINQYKLTNNMAAKLSDDTLLEAIKDSSESWKSCTYPNVLIISYDELFTQSGQDKINNILGTEFKDFPIKMPRG